MKIQFDPNLDYQQEAIKSITDISSTIISQLHNYFLHRLINNKDIEAVEKT